jgi:hypothetical protein
MFPLYNGYKMYSHVVNHWLVLHAEDGAFSFASYFATSVNSWPFECIADAANSISNPPMISYTDFYNCSLDNLDLMSDYCLWQESSSHSEKSNR